MITLEFFFKNLKDDEVGSLGMTYKFLKVILPYDIFWKLESINKFLPLIPTHPKCIN